MSYRLELLPPAQKVFDKLEPQLKRRISKTLIALQENPRPHGYLKLEGSTDRYRIRVGDYRIIYTIEDDRLVVTVLEIASRDKVYKRR